MTQQMDYYSQPMQHPEDLTHLKVLSICHWIWGGFIGLASCVFIIHIGMGAFMLSAAPPVTATGTMVAQVNTTQPVGAVAAATSPATAPAPIVFQPNPAPPAALAWGFIFLGGCLMLFGWATAVMNFISAYGMTRGRYRTVSIIAACVNCLSIPMGTTLAVFTFNFLFRPSVSALYAQGR